MVVAFVGHRKVENKKETVGRIYEALSDLIENEDADTFLFGSRSEFDRLCFRVVTEMKKIYPNIRRVYVRAEWDYDDMKYLLENCEETFYPDKVRGAGAKVYVVRNQILIDMCDVLVAYCDPNYHPPTNTKSGTQMAVSYARKKKKRVINLFEE